MALQHLRSSTADKRPDPTAMADGQIALNTAAVSPGLFYKDSAGNLVKAGPAHVGSTAPNISPASGGTAGNSTGEAWLDTSGSNPLLKIWNGSSWQTVQPVASGTVVSTADTGSVTSTMIANGTIVDADINASAAIAGTKISPDFGSQNVTTTGTVTGASLNPTSSTVPTNGVYLPAANSVGISTGGSGRLFVDASGNVGVATSSPQALFDINGGFYRSVRYGNGGAIQLDSAGGTISSPAAISSSQLIGIIQARGYDGSSYRIGTNITISTDGAVTSTSSPAYVSVATTPSGATAPTERLRITSAGLVGIGTSSPGSKLTVAGSQLQLEINKDDGTADNKRWLFSTGSGFLNVQCLTDAGAGGGNLFRFNRSNEQVQSLQGFKDGAAWFHVDNSTARVGIGTTSPQGTLSIVSGTSTQLTLQTVAGALDTLKFDSWHPSSLKPNYSWCQQGVEAMQLDSSGRLLVGTSSLLTPINSVKQEIGNGNLAMSSFQANAFAYQIGFTKSRSTSTIGTIVQNGDELGNIDWWADDGTSTAKQACRIQAFVDGTPGANDMPGRLVFSTTADGASSPTERMRIVQNGDIIFSNLGNVYPNTDNAVSLGIGIRRWTAVYAVNGTIQTSDEREKTEVTNSALGSEFIKSLRPVSYKWIEGGQVDTGRRDEDGNYIYESVPGVRTHWGFIAQEVKQAVDAAGVDFGGWVLTDKDDPDSQQALRYDQFIAPLTKALQEALEKIEALEAKVAALESA